KMDALANELNLDEIKKESTKYYMNRNNDNVKRNQFAANTLILNEINVTDKIHFRYLFLYAFGIILITINRAKDAIFNNSKEDELKTLLKQVKDQNTKLLHKKEKEND